MEQSPSPDVTVKAINSGPYQIKGPVTVVDHDGKEYELGNRRTVLLCRCGASNKKPFCDGTHARIGFEATERVRDESVDA